MNTTKPRPYRDIARLLRERHGLRLRHAEVCAIEARALEKVRAEFVKWLEGRARERA